VLLLLLEPVILHFELVWSEKISENGGLLGEN
jgi:hypothetical protein